MMRGLAIVVGFAIGGALFAAERTADDPNTLILALDGVGYHHLIEARAQGAFSGWPEPRPLVSTFPSMTNVGFVAILSPLGSERMQGYEVRHYDPEQNKVVGGNPMKHNKYAGSWRNLFDASSTSAWDKALAFVWPYHEARNEIEQVEKLVLESPSERMLGYIGASDPLAHIKGDEPTVRLLLEVSERVERLRQEHQAKYGRPLRVILLSDHGNGNGKIEAAGGVSRALKDAGLHPAGKLKRPEDVVLVSYGVCGYGALFLAHDRAEVASRAMLELEGVEIAAWITGEGEMRVLGRDSDALVRFRGKAPQRSLSYEPRSGDPLHLEDARARLLAAGRLDETGFGTEADWFEASAGGDYPDALSRLVDSLQGRFVRNTATVLFSYAPGYALGIRTARAGAWLLGGKLEGTHGGLDRVSSWGIYQRSDDDGRGVAPMRGDAALAEWADSEELRAAFAAWQERSSLHGPRIVR
jgi:hypothetical protein